MTITRPERKPVGTCQTCGELAYGIETETDKIDVPPYSPTSPQFTTSIPGPTVRTYWPCGHREALD